VESIIDNENLDICISDNDPEQRIAVPERYVDKVRIVRTGGVAGFAAANNLAVEHGRNDSHDSVLLLNNDTVALSDAITKLQGLLAGEKVGAVGPCMPYASDPQKIWACGGVIVKHKANCHGLNEAISSKPFDVDYLPGAAILCRLTVWDLVGGLPEKYFLAYEEAEFAIKVRANGYRVMAHPDAKILHKVGMSSDTQPMYLYNQFRSRLRFGGVLWGKYAGFAVAAFWCLRGSLRSTRGLSIWVRALADEVSGVPLDRASLQRIKLLYEE
jgi:GT2 family glycosyltransferase